MGKKGQEYRYSIMYKVLENYTIVPSGKRSAREEKLKHILNDKK